MAAQFQDIELEEFEFDDHLGIQNEDPKATYFVFRDAWGRRHHMSLSEQQQKVLCTLSDTDHLTPPTGSTVVLGAFREGTIYGGSRSVSGAFLIVRDDKEVGYNLFLSGSQTEALWNSREPRLTRAAAPAGIVHLQHRRILRFESRDPEPSFSCGLPTINPITPIMAKLRKKQPGAGHGDVYQTVWENGHFTSYVNGHQTMTSEDLIPGRPGPQTHLGKAKGAILRSSKRLESILDRAKGKFKKGEKPPVIHTHNPRVVYGTPETKFSRMVHDSRIFSAIAGIVQVMNPFYSPPVIPPNRDWDNRTRETPMVLDDPLSNVGYWATKYDTWTDPENRVAALTTSQLLRLNGSSTDRYQVVKPIYQVPPPSPAPSEAGDECEEAAQNSEGDTMAEDDDSMERLRRLILAAHTTDGDVAKIDEIMKDITPKAKDTTCSTSMNPTQSDRDIIKEADSSKMSLPNEDDVHPKDLRIVREPYSGFYIVSPSPIESMLSVNDNYSDYYNIPLIDPKAGAKAFVDDEVIECKSPSSLFSSSFFIPDEDVANRLHTPRSQVPAQAIIQYLTFKGVPLQTIAKKLSVLDADFLYKSESRWWKKTRIPELWQLNDNIINHVLDVCKSDKLWWEEELDGFGRKIPTALQILQSRVRVTEVKRLAQKSIENYLWWRLRGETVHCDLPKGPLLRQGDY